MLSIPPYPATPPEALRIIVYMRITVKLLVVFSTGIVLSYLVICLFKVKKIEKEPPSCDRVKERINAPFPSTLSYCKGGGGWLEAIG